MHDLADPHVVRIPDISVEYMDLGTNNYEWVDMGLPSGNIWSKYCIGANSETEVGSLFAWGEIISKSESDWTNYKYGSYNAESTPDYGLTKYNNTDGLIILDMSDDAARVNMGGKWQIPSPDDLTELKTNSSIGFGSDYAILTSKVNSNKLYCPIGIWLSIRTSLATTTGWQNAYATFQGTTEVGNKYWDIGNYERTQLYSIKPILKPN